MSETALAQPQDHQSSEFHYKFASGKSVTLPKMKQAMTFGRVRRLRKLPEDEVMFTVIEEICDEATLAVLDEMTPDEMEPFFSAWQEDSGVSLGESPGSST